ncbi:MAG: hypothetical protein K2X81_11115 [Candidatus Obscuribacterales bacterium]|nr:hypothetical protein [Candidatus Obscuribacterales bacterium]
MKSNRAILAILMLFLMALPVLVCIRKAKHSAKARAASTQTVIDFALPLKRTASTWTQKDLIISYCCSAPPSEINMDRAASQHFNLVPAWQETLGFAQKHNVKVMLEHGLLTPKTIHSPEKLKQLDVVIKQVKDNPALGAYYVLDEPLEPAFPEVAAFIEYIRKRDPKHITFVNMLPIYGVPGKEGVDPSKTYLEFLRKYIHTAKPELLSYDYYNFFRRKDGTEYDLPVYFVNLGLVRRAAMEAQIPFMNIIQACTFTRDWRLPTEKELRWQVYTTLAYGGRGISYFLYWGPKSYGGIYQDGQETALIKPVSALNKELAILSPILMNMDSIAVFHTAPVPAGGEALTASSPIQIVSPGEFVIGFFAKEGRRNNFMLVNRDYKNAATANLHIRACTKIKEFDRSKAEWSEVNCDESGNFKIPLEAGDGRLFCF